MSLCIKVIIHLSAGIYGPGEPGKAKCQLMFTLRHYLLKLTVIRMPRPSFNSISRNMAAKFTIKSGTDDLNGKYVMETDV